MTAVPDIATLRRLFLTVLAGLLAPVLALYPPKVGATPAFQRTGSLPVATREATPHPSASPSTDSLDAPVAPQPGLPSSVGLGTLRLPLPTVSQKSLAVSLDFPGLSSPPMNGLGVGSEPSGRILSVGPIPNGLPAPPRPRTSILSFDANGQLAVWSKVRGPRAAPRGTPRGPLTPNGLTFESTQRSKGFILFSYGW